MADIEKWARGIAYIYTEKIEIGQLGRTEAEEEIKRTYPAYAEKIIGELVKEIEIAKVKRKVEEEPAIPIPRVGPVASDAYHLGMVIGDLATAIKAKNEKDSIFWISQTLSSIDILKWSSGGRFDFSDEKPALMKLKEYVETNEWDKAAEAVERLMVSTGDRLMG